MTHTIDYTARARLLDKQIHNLRARHASDADRIEAIAAVLNQVASEKSIKLITAARELANACYFENPMLRDKANAVRCILGDRR